MVFGVAIIGTGAMGLEHMRNLKLLEDCRVAAVVDTDLNARNEAKEIIDQDAVVTTDYQALATMEAVDAIIIATPNYTHIEVLRALIPCGKHILVEKPMCTTVEDSLEVEELVEKHMPPEKGLVFWVGMEYRYMPPVARLLEHTDSGAIGRLIMVHIREHRFPFLLKVADWNRFSQFTGGTLVEKCCHFWDLMRRIIGDGANIPERVFASGGMDINHKHEKYSVQGEMRTPDIVDNAYAIVDFASGVRGCLDLCMFAEDRQHEEVLVVGSQGKVTAETPACTVTLHHPSQRASGDEPSNPRIPPLPDQYEKNTAVEKVGVDEKLLEAGFHEGATFFELKDFIETAKARKPPVVTAQDGTYAVAMGVAAELSLKERRMVEISEVMEAARARRAGAAASRNAAEASAAAAAGPTTKRQKTGTA
eukprot:CAMPEP_0118968462 /NCGR_PEP_ID=MMETSP1173-20130426/5677_1 /TAXON_ID=1034831 /ORGANISM="Rhizochromulina marina cf, Strain CCMP1243" /LENGTH=420 /DNA_ID=CAMNT_0006917581 /DNA_START=87 /DNA_END=1349 /DNA_ORIENTATION=+